MLLLRTNKFTIPAFSFLIALFLGIGYLNLYADNEIGRCSVLIEKHLGHQGLIIGNSGILSLFSSLVESNNHFLLTSLKISKDSKTILERSFQANRHFYVSDALNFHFSFKTQISGEELKGTLVYSNGLLLQIGCFAIVIALLAFAIELAIAFYYEQKMQKKMIEAKHLIAKQISHDIRSPLAALNMIIGQLKDVPEQQRLMLRNSVNRINEIANTLLTKSKNEKSQQSPHASIGDDPPPQLQVELLPPLIDTIVSEKRLQFRDKIDIEIEADLSESYGAFANINAPEFARVISNITNNSLEAMPNGKGKFTLSVIKEKNRVTVIAKDDGKGIPAHILSKLGQLGVTHGKDGTQSGSGLGVYHAKKTIESFGGTFQIESKEGHGTTITMIFPAAPHPKWFVENLLLDPNSVVISVDDDSSIHAVWHARFQSLNIESHNIQYVTFTSLKEFRDFVLSNNSDSLNKIYFVDLEFLNQSESGLDIIETLGIGPRSILVTSLYEEKHIRDRCEKLNVKLLPKSMAALVPVSISKPKQGFDAILIDDDSLIEMTWKMSADQQNKRLAYFSKAEDFLSKASEIAYSSPLFIDSNLGNGVKGEDIAKQAFQNGFKTIYLCTGYDPKDFPPMPWIVKVIGKDPPLNLW